MRQRVFVYSALLVTATLGCRKKTNEVGNVGDTTTISRPAPAPAPAAAETATGARDFGFDQRQEFVQSIRQELAGIDQQIKELAAQAKSKGGAVSDRALANIRKSRQAVEKNLKRVDAATASNWQGVKEGVGRAVENLSGAIEEAQPK
jgi:hypothetical protein